MRPRQYKILLPEPVLKDLKVLITSYYRQFGNTKKSRTFVDSMAFFLSILTNSLVSDHRKNEITSLDHRVPKEHWCTHLYSPILREILGNEYLLVVNYLIDAGFVGRSGHYEIGNGNSRGRSKAYWFTAKYGTYLAKYLNTRSARRFSNESVKVFGKFRTYVVKSKTVLDRWFGILSIRKEESRVNDSTVDRCYRNLEHFSINMKAAEATICKLRAEGKMSKYKEKLERLKIQRFNEAGSEPYAMYVKHDRYGRIHTNVTCMKKELRSSALRCDGKAIGEVDIKSSQIAFIVPIFQRYIDVFRGVVDMDDDTFIQFRPFWHDGQKETTLAEMDSELGQFTSLVNNHQIYEYFAKELSDDFDLDRVVSRDESKHGVVSFLFSPRYFDEDREPVRAAVKRVWEYRFPTLLRCLYSMKQNCHAALAYELQKLESTFIFDIVCPRITNELGCPYCTVHDSIIVPKEYCERLKAIMDEELARVGIPTITDVEYYDMVEASMPCLADEGFFAEMTRRGIKTVDVSELVDESVAFDEE